MENNELQPVIETVLNKIVTFSEYIEAFVLEKS